MQASDSDGWPRIRGHVAGENKFRPIVKSFRRSPQPIRDCVQYLLKQAQVRPGSSRSAAAKAVTAILKHREAVDLGPFYEKGVRPKATYVKRRVLQIRFLVGHNFNKTFIVRLYDNDI